MTRRSVPFTLLAVLLIAATVACALPGTGGGSQPTAQPAEATAAPSDAGGGGGGGGAAQPTAEAPQPTETTAVDETGSLEDLSAGLNNLDSYRVHMVYSFEGKKEDGKATRSSADILQEYVKADGSHHTSISTTGDTPTETQKIDLYVIGEITYWYSPDQPEGQRCLSFSSSDQPPLGTDLVSQIGSSLGSLKNLKLVARGETVNGIVTDHYSFDEGAFTVAGLTKATGEIWIAQESKIAVKYTMTATGKDLSGTSSEGTLTWDYELDQVNAITEIKPPEECKPPASGDIPIPENATEKSMMTGFITFKSPDAPSVVADFYRQAMLEQGWTAGEESTVGDLVQLKYTKESREVSIMITAEGTGSSVLITESGA